MSTTEHSDGPGTGAPSRKQAGGDGAPKDVTSASDIKTALQGFLSDFKAFRADTLQTITKQEERLNMLDRKTAPLGRPALSTAVAGAQHEDLAAPHAKAFEAYLRSGEDDALRGLELEGKAMSTAVAGDGGYLVDPVTSETIRAVLDNTASIRAVANVVNVEAGSYDVLVDRGDLETGWSSETGNQAETNTPAFERIAIQLHELSAMPKASQRLLDDSAFDIDAWLAGRIAEKFTTAEGKAFVTGDGIDKPRGFLNHTIADNATWQWGQIGYIASGASGNFNGSVDPLIDLVYALPAPYRANAIFVMNSKTAGSVRKFKDAEGRFVWADGIAAGQPAMLLGYPVLIAEDMPDIDNNAAAIAFGDFSAGYTIAERPDVRVLRDPFSAKPNVLFYATKRVGGDVTDFAAIKVLRFSAS
ncbi:MAG: phage major capsid protein [Pseudomonadota bacterium]